MGAIQGRRGEEGSEDGSNWGPEGKKGEEAGIGANQGEVSHLSRACQSMETPPKSIASRP
jgi:hypothetical protein